ncbi:aspartate oxidase [Lasius niger]|uniref:Aspartate oxidase n=1 Tax=Lasius niger TaxID=67767 RepID=A0A0J7KPA1_LASNI|nr:aspartate oxidase [Lasius niger]
MAGRDEKYNTHHIIDSAAEVGRRGGPEGSDGRRWGQYVDGPLVDGDSGRFHADPIRAVILSEGGAAKETMRGQ